MRNLLVAAAVLSFAGLVHGASSFSLDFNGTSAGANPTLAETGFSGAFNYAANGLTLGGGRLTTTTLGGDSFGDYDNDPDTAKNWLYNTIDVGPTTVATAKLTVRNLSENFHGGGIWIGTDQDHYARLGVFHNSFVAGGPVAVELLRENEDRWTGRNAGNPGDDIVSTPAPAVGPLTVLPLDVVLRLTRNGNNIAGEYSLNNGATFLSLGTIGGLALPGNTTGVSNTIESNTLKVGIYTAGGASANFAFDSLTAVTTPEPASLSALALGGLLLRRRR